MKKYKYIITLAFIAVTLLYLNQCSNTKEVSRTLANRTKELNKLSGKYISLLEAKQKSDTIIVQGPADTVIHNVPVPVHDTIIDSVEYKVYKDSIRSEELRLDVYAVASDVQVLRYTYDVTQKIITHNSIITQHDTLRLVEYKRSLYGTFDAGLQGASAGLTYIGKKRLGMSAKYNIVGNERFYTVGVLYKFF